MTLCFDATTAEALRAHVSGSIPVCDDGPRRKVPAPRINARIRIASASRRPWIVANGWRFVRKPGERYLCEPPAGKAALAMAEAFAYDADAGFRLAPEDVEKGARMLSFLRSIPTRSLPPLADFALVDDGSGRSGEAMNLLTRRNLLFAIVREPDSRYSLNVVIGSPEFPRALAANPGELATAVRNKLTDERRSLRLYGSESAIIRALGDGETARLHILNYTDYPLDGIRLRIRGTYSITVLRAFGYPEPAATDLTTDHGFTEFTIPETGPYAVVDLR